MKNTEPRYAVYIRSRDHGKPFGAWRYKSNRRLDFTEYEWVPLALRFAAEVTYSVTGTYGVTEYKIRPLKTAAK